MSTKIYDAYRIKSRKPPWDLLWALKDQAIKDITEKTKAYYRLKVQDVIYTEPDFNGDPGNWQDRLSFVHKMVREGVKSNSGSIHRDPYDVKVVVTVSPYKGRYYLRAFCDQVSDLVGGSLDFLESHPDLEDYHYDNSSCRPEAVSQKKWRQRDKTWKGIFSGDGKYPRQLSLDICDATDWWMLDPHAEVASELRHNLIALPSLEQLAVNHLTREEFFGPAVQATFEPGKISGDHFEILKKGTIYWEARVGEETISSDFLIKLVDWVKAHFMSPEKKAILDRMTTRFKE